ncbi:MAG: sulfur oxidation c-type cytochrome SoxX [Pseudomonadota bacterium]
MRLWFWGLALALASCTDAEPQLVSEDQIVGDAIPAPLSADPGSAQNGRNIFVDRERGHCVLCHAIEGLEAEFQGNVGPDLSTVGERLSAGQLRLRIVDYQIVRPGTLMPSYYRIHDLYQVAEEFQDAPILTSTEVEDLVAYLSERR